MLFHSSGPLFTLPTPLYSPLVLPSLYPPDTSKPNPNILAGHFREGNLRRPVHTPAWLPFMRLKPNPTNARRKPQRAAPSIEY